MNNKKLKNNWIQHNPNKLIFLKLKITTIILQFK